MRARRRHCPKLIPVSAMNRRSMVRRLAFASRIRLSIPREGSDMMAVATCLATESMGSGK